VALAAVCDRLLTYGYCSSSWLSDKHDGPRIFVKVCQRPLARPNQIAHDKASPASTRPPVMSVFGRRAAALSRLDNGLGLSDSHGE
jgi:hypothetical protein